MYIYIYIYVYICNIYIDRYRYIYYIYIHTYKKILNKKAIVLLLNVQLHLHNCKSLLIPIFLLKTTAIGNFM